MRGPNVLLTARSPLIISRARGDFRANIVEVYGRGRIIRIVVQFCYGRRREGGGLYSTYSRLLSCTCGHLRHYPCKSGGGTYGSYQARYCGPGVEREVHVMVHCAKPHVVLCRPVVTVERLVGLWSACSGVPVVRVASLSRPNMRVFDALARTRLHGQLRPSGKVFVTRDPGIVRITLRTRYRPITVLYRRGRVLNSTTGLVRRYNSVPICAKGHRLLTRLANCALAHKILYTVQHPVPGDMGRVYHGTRHIMVVGNIISAAGVKTVFHSTTTLNVSTMLLAPGSYSPLGHQTIEISVNSMFLVP